MILVNITKGDTRENIVLVSLKEKKEEEDIVIGPGEVKDTQILGVSERKVETSSEVKAYVEAKKLALYRDTNDMQEKMGSSQGDAVKAERKMLLDDIAGTSALSRLEDILANSKDPELKDAARRRMVELTGSDGPENPELNNSGQQNPRI
jgi:hypothetical protein